MSRCEDAVRLGNVQFFGGNAWCIDLRAGFHVTCFATFYDAEDAHVNEHHATGPKFSKRENYTPVIKHRRVSDTACAGDNMIIQIRQIDISSRCGTGKAWANGAKKAMFGTNYRCSWHSTATRTAAAPAQCVK